MNKYDIIEPNEFGRKKIIRYKQYMYLLDYSYLY